MRLQNDDLNTVHLAALQFAHFLHQLRLKRLQPAARVRHCSRKKQHPSPAALHSHALHRSGVRINFLTVKFLLPTHVTWQKHCPSHKFQNGVPVASGGSERIVAGEGALAARAQAHRAPGDDVPCLRVAVAEVPLKNDAPSELHRGGELRESFEDAI
jgi:hypothetical protein